MPDGPYQYTSVYPAITDVTSDNQELLALIYGNSNEDTYNAIAFQVVRSVRRIERVEDSITLSDNGTQNFGWFGENGFSRNVNSPGTEVFSIQSERERTIVEYGFGVPQSGVYVGIQTADGATLDGLSVGDERGRGLDAATLNQRAGVLSDTTVVDTPAYTNSEPIPTTALSEREDQGLIRVDSEQNGPNRFFFAFNNQSGGQVTIDVTGIGVAYDVRPIFDGDVARSIVSGEGFDRRLVQYGPFDNTNPNLPEEWYNARVRVGPGELTPAAPPSA